MTDPVFEITKVATFDAAHCLPDGNAARGYTRVHGHSFQVSATVRGAALGAVGWVVDLADLDEALKAAARMLDHGMLNEVPGLDSPTLENLCLFFVAQLQPGFPGLAAITVSRPTIGESCNLRLA
jgi:6-pyruvoyltetrahydropterin/6-carboxytetrahydropterin synthase